MAILNRLNMLNIFWIVLLLTAFLAIIFKNDKKRFVISTTFVHAFVCGFRYMFIAGDLMKYNSEFYKIAHYGWRSSELISGGRNTLFYILNKVVYIVFDGDFQMLLIIIALITNVILGWIIYKYSPRPFLSFLMWNCFGFYLFSFPAIKQILAMAFIMLAVVGIFENKFKYFLIFTVIAGFIHFPAFVFLPAYHLAKIEKMPTFIIVFSCILITILLLRNDIVNMMADLYYEGESFVEDSGIGGKALMMFALMIAGYLLCGFSDDIARKLFLLLSAASLLQLFSIYDNIFTRLADYYFQFIVLYAPYMFAQIHREPQTPPMYFTDRSIKILTSAFVVLSLVYYQYTSFRTSTIPSVDNVILNFKFMWEVEDTSTNNQYIQTEQ